MTDASASCLTRADAAGIARAVGTLEAGGLVAIPTETVYGLAGDASRAGAVARIYAVKGRPRFNPLIAHVHDPEAAVCEGSLDAVARSLADAFWPGPLTLVVPVSPRATVCELARAGLDSVALRVPAHPVARALLAEFARPLVAPSANRSGGVSPTRALDVVEELGDAVDLILDGGICEHGIESTIVAVLPDRLPCILRPGAVTRARIEAVAGKLAPAGEAAVRAPGQLASHYAPAARVRLDARQAREDEALLGFGPDAPAGCLNLSASGDTTEAAANLYAMLRRLDATGVAGIAVMPVPMSGLGEAVNDRLRRAAAPRGPG